VILAWVDMALTVSSLSKDARTGKTSYEEMKSLLDVNDSHELGTYTKLGMPARLMDCRMEGNQCQSDSAWDLWAKQCMER